MTARESNPPHSNFPKPDALRLMMRRRVVSALWPDGIDNGRRGMGMCHMGVRLSGRVSREVSRGLRLNEGESEGLRCSQGGWIWVSGRGGASAVMDEYEDQDRDE